MSDDWASLTAQMLSGFRKNPWLPFESGLKQLPKPNDETANNN